MSAYLTKAELEDLTGKKYAKCQEFVLAQNGFEFKRISGRIRLLRAHHDEVMGAKTSSVKHTEPDLDALREVLRG